MGKNKINILAILLMMLLLTGCKTALEESETENGAQEPVSQSGGQEAGAPKKEETEPSAAQEDAQNVPDIAVNQLGYITERDKVAIFSAQELPQEFHVVRADSGEVVFAGYLRDNGYNEAGREYNGYGDFSEVQESGSYYIEAPILGKSYSFRIGDELYQGVLEEACKSYGYGQEERIAQSLPAAAGDMAVALLAYELNTGVFTDDMGTSESGNEIPDLLDEVRHGAEWMLKQQNQETGSVSAGIAGAEGWEAAFAMALAKFSYLYQAYDTDFATQCLRAADRAWMYADLSAEQQTQTTSEHGWKLAAAAELYRASGNQSFYDYILEYFEDGNACGEAELPALMGYITYIATKQPVDLEICREITGILTERADRAAEGTGEILWENREGEPDGDYQEILENSIYLTVINHLMTSREYEVTIENILHYLMGRNRQSVSYIKNAGENYYAPGKEPIEDNSRLILLLSEIIGYGKVHEGKEE